VRKGENHFTHTLEGVVPIYEVSMLRELLHFAWPYVSPLLSWQWCLAFLILWLIVGEFERTGLKLTAAAAFVNFLLYGGLCVIVAYHGPIRVTPGVNTLLALWLVGNIVVFAHTFVDGIRIVFSERPL